MMRLGGLDLGRLGDRTVLIEAEGEPSDLEIRELSWLPPTPTWADQATVLAPKLDRCDLVCVDATGVGDAALEIFRQHSTATLVPVVSVAGNTDPGLSGQRLTVGRVWLIGLIMSAMADGVIGIPACLPDRDRLRRELEAFVVVAFAWANLMIALRAKSLVNTTRSSCHQLRRLSAATCVWR